MAAINEIKEQMTVVRSVGDFTNALQQIATIRMMRLRSKVLASRPFVEKAQEILHELSSLRNALREEGLYASKPHDTLVPIINDRRAVVVITSNQGLTGLYNIEIYQKIEKILEQEQNSDFYVIGKKGQEYFQGGRFKVANYPYDVPENFTVKDLQRLTAMFDFYPRVTLVYSRFINSATRDVVATSIISPTVKEEGEETKAQGKFTYEPDIDLLIEGISRRLRNALFQQQIFDSRLSQNAAQMIGMQTASDNAKDLLADLQIDYNKQRRKLIDKKIGEVFAGSALW